MVRLIAKLGPKLGKIAFWVVLGLLALALLGLGKCAYDQTAKTQLKVSKNQTDAAIKSGVEAVNTVGNRQEAELAGAQNVQEAQDEINNASDPGAVTDAGLAGLHRVRVRQTDRSRR